MPFNITIPTSADSLNITIETTHTLFVLGANGSGKSSLMHRIYAENIASARRISAHRQIWFESGSNSLSSAQYKSTQTQMRNYDRKIDSRWQDAYGIQRPNMALYDLLDSQNIRAREIAIAVDNGDQALAMRLSKKDAPLKIINELLRTSNIDITISILPGDEIAATRNGSATYSVAKLSDGERNALLIAADVLTAPAGTLMLIDEPERHLHRSIISPLLTNLFRQRSDCAFVVSTHDVELCMDNPDSKVLLLRGCRYSGESIVSWDVDYLPKQQEIDNSIREEIIGGRRSVLFVEGTDNGSSLDRPLYSIIFPRTTVVPSVSCRDVEHAVAGIRGSEKLHWIRAFGIVDNDHRTANDIEKLKASGVYALDFFSVESIYYHPEIQKRVALRQSQVDGSDALAKTEQAAREAIDSIRPHVERLCVRVAEKELREKMMGLLPTHDTIKEGKPIEITLDCAAIVQLERTRLVAALDAGNILTAIEHYPVRETPALDRIASRLGFQNRRQYEAAVLKLLTDDADALSFIRTQLFASLIAELAT